MLVPCQLSLHPFPRQWPLRASSWNYMSCNLNFTTSQTQTTIKMCSAQLAMCFLCDALGRSDFFKAIDTWRRNRHCGRLIVQNCSHTCLHSRNNWYNITSWGRCYFQKSFHWSQLKITSFIQENYLLLYSVSKIVRSFPFHTLNK